MYRPPLIETGMTRDIVVKLLGKPNYQELPKKESAARHREVFLMMGQRYELVFEKDIVVAIKEQPLNAEKVPLKVLFAFYGNSENSKRYQKATETETSGFVYGPMDRFGLLIVLAVIAGCCLIPYLATAVQVVAIGLIFITMTAIGLIFSPVGWIVIAKDIITALLGGLVEEENPATVWDVLTKYIGFLFQGVAALVISSVLLVCAEPMGGMVSFLQEKGKGSQPDPVLNTSLYSPNPVVESIDPLPDPSLMGDSAIEEQTGDEGLSKATQENLSTPSQESIEPESEQAIADVRKIARTWTDNTGTFNVEAICISCDSVFVTLKRTDGKQITVKRERLSTADEQWLNNNFPRSPE